MDEWYGHRAPFATRWADNDMYGHLNNTVYYEAMDTTINVWLIDRAGLDPMSSAEVAYCVSSACDFRAPAAFPEPLEVGLRAGRLGESSITWELGVLRPGTDEAIATGRFVHVFVDQATGRPCPIPSAIRTAVERSLVPPA